MEHEILERWAADRGITLDERMQQGLLTFARRIYETNLKYNLTGLKTLKDIIQTLLLDSLDPFVFLNVPRGTLFADIGTGAGIPGIPLAIYCNAWKGVLIDSNIKKISFVQAVIEECSLDNCDAIACRIEECARTELRSAFDFVFSRALGEIYYAVEMAAPLLKQGGLLYIYSHNGPEQVPEPIVRHAGDMGLSIIAGSRFKDLGIRDTGIVFIKSGATDRKYPRRNAIIKREMKRCLRS